MQCYCESCRGFAQIMDAGDQVLNSDGGVELFQTTPNDIKIVKGIEMITASSITSKGPLRWYCTKCQTPLANTIRKPGVPFMGVILPVHMHLPNASELGHKISCIYQFNARPNAKKNEKNNQGMLNGIRGVISRMVIKFITGKARKSDWHQDGNWRLTPKILSKIERDQLYQRAKTL